MSNTAVVLEMDADHTKLPRCCRGKTTAGQAFAPELRAAKTLRAAMSYVLTIAASVLLLLSLKLPLWRMHLEAPQYRDEEALNIAVHPDR
ncbi:MAG TPA: hypothetical protein VL793_06320, partial [Patescibacteria group bacterium]|nr:hypothetical protein [Patescibacteria group bacterium]